MIGENSTGILYQDGEITLTRSASGVVSMWCRLPVQVWPASDDGRACVCVVGFQENEDGSLTEITTEPRRRQRRE
jgi:hypothetical protein